MRKKEYDCTRDDDDKTLSNNLIRSASEPSSSILNKGLCCCLIRNTASCSHEGKRVVSDVVDAYILNPSSTSTYHYPAHNNIPREADHKRMDTLTQRINRIDSNNEDSCRNNLINEIKTNNRWSMILEDASCTRHEKEEDNILYNNNINNHNSSVDYFDRSGNTIGSDVNIISTSLDEPQHSMRDYTTEMNSQMFNTINPKCDHLPTISEQNDSSLTAKNIMNTDFVKVASSLSSVTVTGVNNNNNNTRTVNCTNLSNVSNQAPEMESVPSIMDCVHRDGDTSQTNRDNAKVYVQQKIHHTVQQKACDEENNSTTLNHEMINNTIHSNQLNCQGSSSHDNNNNMIVQNNNKNVKNINSVSVQYKKRWNSFPVKSS